MTFKELGQLVKENPVFREAYGDKLDIYPDEFLADRLLQTHPEYWRLLSPGAQRIRDLIETPISTGMGFFDSWSDFYQNERQNIENRQKVIQLMHEADLRAQATERGLSLNMLENEHAADLTIRVEEQRSRIKMKEYWDTATLDLDAADRSELKQNYQMAWLDSQLTSLYKRREELSGKRNNASRDELRLVNVRIKIHEDQLNAWGQNLVSDSKGRGILAADSEAISVPDSPTTSETDSESLSTTDARTVKRPAGFVS